jgi:hypothetical protein
MVDLTVLVTVVFAVLATVVVFAGAVGAACAEARGMVPPRTPVTARATTVRGQALEMRREI